MKYIFLTLGTKGDLNPFLGLAREMKRRGHETLILTSEAHRKDCVEAGIPCEAIQSAEDHEAYLNDPNIWVPMRGLKVYLQKGILPATKKSFEVIERHHKSGPCALIANNLLFGALLAHEKLGIPLTTVFLQPYAHMSVVDPAKDSPQNNAIMKMLGVTGRRFLFRGYMRLLNSWLQPLHAIRSDLGLPRMDDFMGAWRYSAPTILNLWPDWYCAPKFDWPAAKRMHQVGFVDYERAGGEDWIARLKIGDLLDQKPVIFTMGSEMKQSLDRQYDLFSQTCLRLRKPGLMVSSAWRKPVPRSSSIDFRIIPGAPYSQLFQHASVVLTHGGIGTVAKAIGARKPIVAAPMAHDQFDNGHLVERLGLGSAIPFRSMNTMNLGRALERARNVAPIAFHPSQKPAPVAACDVIERVLAEASPAALINNF